MERKNRILTRLTAAGAVGLLSAALCMAAAGVGTENDPLVTYSYLTQTFAPALMTQVEEAISTSQQDFVQQLSDATQTEEASYAVVSLQQGQTLIGEIGCELILRVGTAVCVSEGSPGLIDTTSGSVLDAGGELQKNHLYAITITNRGFKATSAVKVLIKGSYTIR